MSFERARAIADAVMVEGYALYPYRASAPKNRYRWTFGVLAPRPWSEAGGCEAWWLEAQVLVAGAPQRLIAQLRFFQVARRHILGGDGRALDAVEHDGRLAVGWDEGVVRTIDVELYGDAQLLAFELDGEQHHERLGDATVVREQRPLAGLVRWQLEPVVAERPLVRLTVRVENTTAWTEPGAPRDHALLGALASTHLALAAPGGELLSALDPPAWARAAAAGCRSVRTYPVLVGADQMLCAPFILYDHPQIAPESAGDLCDATEIDELLVLRTRNLTDAEKRHARATDPRAAAIVDRADALADADLARLHGAARDVRDGEMSPAIGAGTKVRLLAPTRPTDAQDLLYAGQIATVVAVKHDVDGTTFLAVTIDGDPATELHDWYGRYRYYRLDEVELLCPTS